MNNLLYCVTKVFKINYYATSKLNFNIEIFPDLSPQNLVRS